jgi:DNA-binding transcriptional ArsR family regulator
MKAKTDAVAHAINHEIRRLLIEALWHHHDSLTAERFYGDWIEDSRVSISQIRYHVRQLVRDGIIKLDGGEGDDFAKRPFVLAGPHSSEAVRLLGLTPSRPS